MSNATPAAAPAANHRFPDFFRIRVPRGLPQAVERAAELKHTNPSEWARQALLCALRSEGVPLGVDHSRREVVR